MNFLLWLQQHRTSPGESVFGALTYLGSDVMVIITLCVLLWVFGKKIALRTAITFAGTSLFNQLVKIIFAIPRPWVLDSRLTPASGAVEGATGYSFPSGHSQTATCIFGSIALYFRRRWLSILCGVLILVVMFSRMYLGVHTPWDVLTGFALSLTLTWLLSRMLENAERSPNYYRYVLYGGVAGSLLVTAFVIIKIANGTPVQMISDTIPAAGGALGFVIGIYYDSRHEDVLMPYKWSIFMSVMGIVIVLLLKMTLSGILYLFPGALWQDYVCYAAIAVYISGIHPAFMRMVKRRLSIANRAETATADD